MSVSKSCPPWKRRPGTAEDDAGTDYRLPHGDGLVVTATNGDRGHRNLGLKAIHTPPAAGGRKVPSLIVEGDEDDVNRCLDFIEGIKGEPPLPAVKEACKGCGAPCSFSGKDVQELPAYLR
jgi:hypothetical protein